jgi:tetratricopeptide (TPR) repeat protein
LALSIASGFVRRVAVTEKTVSYSIADGNFENAKILIEAGAFDLAIEQLQLATADNPDPDDLYNLGLCFEAVGDYGLALTTYREAWQSDPENLLFAQGLGRIERLRREHPQLQRQLESR